MLRCLIAITSLVTATVAAADVWTWVDAQGRRHFSDRPVEGATQIQLSDGQSFSSAEARVTPPAVSSTPATTEREERQEPEVTEYSVLSIASPAAQEMLHGIAGTLDVQVVIYPPLRTGDTIDVILDGERVSVGARSVSFQVPGAWRGEHTLQAIVSSAEGEDLKESSPVTFFVRQQSTLQPAPQRAIPPRRPGAN